MSTSVAESSWANSGRKRAFDVVMSAAALAVLAPLIFAGAILVRLSSPGPILFRQARLGLHNKQFDVVKLRTMYWEYSSHADSINRVTQAGKWLRQFGIDELPQLLSVLKGDMSLIGPRPLLPEYLPFYTEAELARHDVRPGLSGLAQVSGRNSVSWDEKLELDVRYARSASAVMDFRIIVGTLRQILSREQTNVSGTRVATRLDEMRSQS